MKYVIYAALVFLSAWAVWYLVRRVRKQTKGDCGCGCEGCDTPCDREKHSGE